MTSPRDATLAHIARKFAVDTTRTSPWRPVEMHCRRREGLLDLWRELGFKVGAEIGVEQGRYSEHICRGVPGVKLYCIDPWLAYTRYKDEVSQAKLDNYHAEAVERLAPYGAVIIRKPSMDAVRDFAPESLDFVFVDGNHEYRYVVDDIDEWSKIVRPGGIVAGHDYRGLDQLRNGSRRLPFHVIGAVNGFVDSWELQPLFVLKGDKAPSWMFVKP